MIAPRAVAKGIAILALLGAVVAAWVAWLNVRGEAPLPRDGGGVDGSAAQVERGAYLARIGNCAGCHTDRGGAAYAGGRGIATPFGTVYASNLTPDLATGIGSWSPAEFWRALHHGRSKDGRLLYPAFPYPSYTLVTREDADALYAFLRSQVAVEQPNRPHALRFPYSLQASLAVWRALFFAPESFEPSAAKSARWNRGAYLVRGLGHCTACHAPRNALGATRDALEPSGGLVPMQKWYAPALTDPGEAGVADWPAGDVVRLLKDGRSSRGAVLGPMADVVFRSTQYLGDDDLLAIAEYLRGLPQRTPRERPTQAVDLDPAIRETGAALYRDQCAPCHGDRGEGAGPYPALAGNRVVTMAPTANLVRVIVSGGFPPTTAGNPRPYGMPPFGQRLDDAQVAAVASFVRSAWGNAAAAVDQGEVERAR